MKPKHIIAPTVLVLALVAGLLTGCTQSAPQRPECQPAIVQVAPCDPCDSPPPVALEAADTTTFTNLAAGDLSLTDDLTVADDATITDDLAVTGLATVGETLSVAGATNFLLDATAVTTHTTATAAMSGELISNIGATGGVTLTLPVAAEGLHFCLYTYAAQSFEINPDDADQIHHLTDAAGDAVRNGTAGDKICIIAIDATNWVPIEEHGTWTDVN